MPSICAYCGGHDWRTNLRGGVECAGCAAPAPPARAITTIRNERGELTDVQIAEWYSQTYAGQKAELSARLAECKQAIGDAFLAIVGNTGIEFDA